MFSGSRFASVLPGFARIAFLFGLLLLAAPGFSQDLPGGSRLVISASGAPVIRNGISSSTYQLTATVFPPNATNQGVQWSSNNPSVATVDSTGFVTAHSVGTAIITATTIDGTLLSASCEITVIKAVVPVSGVTLSKDSLSMAKGSQRQLMAAVAPANATNKRVVWFSSDPAIAAVGAFGLVTAKAAGTATITGTTQDGNIASSCIVTVRSVSSSIGEWASVSAGNGHSLGIKSDGTLWAWGLNNSGQLGLGDTVDRNVPSRVGTTNDWSQVWACSSHSLAIKVDGSLWSWGHNTNGQLGLDDTEGRLVPTKIGVDTDWIALGGFGSSYALKSNGTLWAWGQNNYGQLGMGDNVNRIVPIQVGIDEDWVSISSRDLFVCALKSDGSLWAWGRNQFGQLGVGDDLDRNIPARVGEETDWLAIRGLQNCCIALKSNGTLWAWGGNNNGRLGLGDTMNRIIPTQVGIDDDWTAIAPGSSSCLAFKNNGSLWGWGYNSTGTLGLGDTAHRYIPTRIGTDHNWVSASSSAWTLAIKVDGSLWSWGLNSLGQLGIGSNENRLTPVPAIMPVTGVSLDLASATINSGSTQQLTATVYPLNATNKEVQWSSSIPSVVTVDSTGLVTAIGVGTATITVRSLDGAFSAECVVTVDNYNPVLSVSLSPSSLVIGKGDTKRLVATVEPPNVTDSSVS